MCACRSCTPWIILLLCLGLLVLGLGACVMPPDVDPGAQAAAAAMAATPAPPSPVAGLVLGVVTPAYAYAPDDASATLGQGVGPVPVALRPTFPLEVLRERFGDVRELPGLTVRHPEETLRLAARSAGCDVVLRAWLVHARVQYAGHNKRYWSSVLAWAAAIAPSWFIEDEIYRVEIGWRVEFLDVESGAVVAVQDAPGQAEATMNDFQRGWIPLGVFTVPGSLGARNWRAVSRRLVGPAAERARNALASAMDKTLAARIVERRERAAMALAAERTRRVEEARARAEAEAAERARLYQVEPTATWRLPAAPAERGLGTRPVYVLAAGVASYRDGVLGDLPGAVDEAREAVAQLDSDWGWAGVRHVALLADPGRAELDRYAAKVIGPALSELGGGSLQGSFLVLYLSGRAAAVPGPSGVPEAAFLPADAQAANPAGTGLALSEILAWRERTGAEHLVVLADLDPGPALAGDPSAVRRLLPDAIPRNTSLLLQLRSRQAGGPVSVPAPALSGELALALRWAAEEHRPLILESLQAWLERHATLEAPGAGRPKPVLAGQAWVVVR